MSVVQIYVLTVLNIKELLSQERANSLEKKLYASSSPTARVLHRDELW